MKEIDRRKKQDIYKEIRQMAASYTPEWQFDEENPDIGTALAMIYGDLFSDTIKRYNRILDKNKIAFFNELETRLMPSLPARGFITFGLSTDGFGGAAVPKGTSVLSSETAEDGEAPVFQTLDPIYVTPSKLEAVFQTDGEGDRIEKIWDAESLEADKTSFTPFMPERENLQKHEAYFGFDNVLCIKGKACVGLVMKPHGKKGEKLPALNWLAKEEKAVFEYEAETGFQPFAEAVYDKGKLLLYKEKEQPPFFKTERFGQEAYWVRCRLQEKEAGAELQIDDMEAFSAGSQLIPDMIQTGEGEQIFQRFYPYGERPEPYAEVYIASEEALSKKGARITLSFYLDFDRVPLNMTDETPRDWKLVMKKSDFKPDPEYDVTIEQVVWEYYNGSGWSRLFGTGQYSDLFSASQGTLGQKLSLEFLCPPDAERILLNSTESRFIRVRVLKMNNLFKMKGAYITPVISEIHFDYEYKGKGSRPVLIAADNNMKLQLTAQKQVGNLKEGITIFQRLQEKERCLYLGFTMPLDQGPLKLLLAMEETIHDPLPGLRYEYWSDKGWKNLPVIDGTGSMKRTEIVTFMGQPDFSSCLLWGQERYWIRIIDETNQYPKMKKTVKIPRIRGIYLNSTRIMGAAARPEEWFSIEAKEENKVCQLKYPDVYEIEVWVDEAGHISPREQETLEKAGRIKCLYDKEGSLSNVWVRWEEKEDFYLSEPEDRHYTVDRNNGTVSFSDGRKGAIPAARRDPSIWVIYNCSGGERTNQPEGKIDQMQRSVGFINRIMNPEITTGGCAQETAAEAIKRRAKSLRHKGRAVTARDFEALVMEGARNVWKAKCFSNRNEQGRKEPGSVTVVVLQKDFKTGKRSFDSLKNQIKKYMYPRIPGNMAALEKLYVAEPTYLELRCRIDLMVKDYNQAFEVKQEVLEKIEEYLDPVSGNYNKKGWEIGEIPKEAQIINAIKGVSGISLINGVYMSAYTQTSQGAAEVDLQDQEGLIYAVGLSGHHEINIQMEI